MRYHALAADYDGTLATSGKMSAAVEGALERLRSSGRRAVLVTGRTLEELTSGCPRMELFDAVVLENGGVLYSPPRRQTTVLCPPASPELAWELARRGVEPVSGAGRSWRPGGHTRSRSWRRFATWASSSRSSSTAARSPSGVNKGSGLEAALREMGLSVHEVVGVGNAENDHSFLGICECAVAVDNAVAAIKAQVDFCTSGADGSGVAELIEELMATDLAGRAPGGTGDLVVLAVRRDGTPATFPPYGHNILVSGPSGAGKSTFATGSSSA
jgi:hydroxymethylpyrimidine pyrophosphatase-like HAD family hydrolase